MSEEIRNLHNAVADRDDATASTRPPATTAADLRRMVRDVLAKLSVNASLDTCEIGAGTGLLAIPLAKLSRSFVGVDFAEAALTVLDRRLTESNLSAKAQTVKLDFTRATPEELAALGSFDRVLVYATLHYAGGDTEVRQFFDQAVGLLRPGGRALFGNLPCASDPRLVRPVRWRAEAVTFRSLRKVRRLIRREHGAGPTVHGLVPLDPTMLEECAARAGAPYQWLLPAVGIPIFHSRFDLLVEKSR